MKRDILIMIGIFIATLLTILYIGPAETILDASDDGSPSITLKENAKVFVPKKGMMPIEIMMDPTVGRPVRLQNGPAKVNQSGEVGDYLIWSVKSSKLFMGVHKNDVVQ